MTRKQTAGIIHEMPCDGPASFLLFEKLWKSSRVPVLQKMKNDIQSSEIVGALWPNVNEFFSERNVNIAAITSLDATLEEIVRKISIFLSK